MHFWLQYIKSNCVLLFFSVFHHFIYQIKYFMTNYNYFTVSCKIRRWKTLVSRLGIMYWIIWRIHKTFSSFIWKRRYYRIFLFLERIVKHVCLISLIDTCEKQWVFTSENRWHLFSRWSLFSKLFQSITHIYLHIFNAELRHLQIMVYLFLCVLRREFIALVSNHVLIVINAHFYLT